MIYLAAICMQQMPANISLGLWTISVMEEAEEGSSGRGAAFVPAGAGARWCEGLAFWHMFCVPYKK